MRCQVEFKINYTVYHEFIQAVSCKYYKQCLTLAIPSVLKFQIVGKSICSRSEGSNFIIVYENGSILLYLILLSKVFLAKIGQVITFFIYIFWNYILLYNDIIKYICLKVELIIRFLTSNYPVSMNVTHTPATFYR